ncbi:MAG: ABC transporter substrate-binding protein [Saccharospirillaceae bacterium]|nr:hypothetical protein A3759_14240 [Thalassolituus sp. HI0120]MCH2041365.1 ABC transporter substrate-binding protein [Saccharospirillaceae bacterium]
MPVNITWTRLLKIFTAFIVCFSALTHANTSAESNNQPRIISIDGSITEIVYELGAGGQLVAVDTTSRHPKAALELPDVGYMRRLSTEGILSMQPDMVIASQDAGPAEVFTQLQQAGVEVVRIQSQYSLDGVLAKVDQVAQALGEQQKGKQLQQNIRQKTEQALAEIPEGASRKSLFILGAGNRGLMAAGKNTQAQAMLDLVSADNVMEYEGYKPVSAEGALLANPEVVLVAYTGPADPEGLTASLAMTDAQKNNRIHTINTSVVLGFGPRLAEAVEQLVTVLYPQNVVGGD